MTAASPVADPLEVLPPEIVLNILEFSPVSSLASLTAVSKAWNSFIDDVHREAIYASESKTAKPPGCGRDFSFLSESTSFAKLFDGLTSWKEVCKRQRLLSRNWAASRPVTRELVLQIGNDPVWRFRPDFKRRFFVSTSQVGGLNVTDMDTGRILWRLPSTLDRDEDAVRPYAHLEYQDGMAVFDREGDAVEVWQADQEGAMRGEFRRIAILNHNCQTRGFQLSHWTLCVVSNRGKGFVYDMAQRPPKLTTRVEIEMGGVGHLDQSADVVIYSMGTRGYHAHDKATGAFLGVLQPSQCTDKYHVRPPNSTASSAAQARATRNPPGEFRDDFLDPVEIAKGPLPMPDDPDHVWEGENEWGSGMLHGDLFVGFSRAGRVFVCSDWRKALQSQADLAEHSSLLECETDGSDFDLGGWLSVRNHRLMFEIQDRVYIVSLDDNNKLQDVDHRPARASFSLPTGSVPQLSVPVSFMALYDDAIMTTYGTLGWRRPNPNLGIHRPDPGRIFPTKAIRIISLAPDLPNSNPASSPSADTSRDPASTDDNLDNLYENHPPAHEFFGSQTGFLQLIRMLGDLDGDVEHHDLENDTMDEDDSDDDEWEDEDENEGEGEFEATI